MPSAGLRPLVTDSWMRSSAAGVRPDLVAAPVALTTDELRERRREHPLWQAMPVLQDVIGQAVLDCDALMAVADEQGQLLFVHGSSASMRRAENIGFVEGSSWDERVAGTNAPGTALALGRPVEVRGEEHFRSAVHRWSCAAVPIRDLRTGGIVGAVDVTGGDQIVVPQTMAMLRAAAALAELHLRELAPKTTPVASVRAQALGTDSMQVEFGGRTAQLSGRHSEIIVALTEHPHGLRGDEIACALYESDGGDSTVRAEIVRLRKILGEEILGSRPYRLEVEVAGDWTLVEAAVARGDLATAIQRYAGPLLPHSVAPAVVEVRERVHRNLGQAVAASGRPDLLATWTRRPWAADDHRAWSALAQSLPNASPLRPVALTQLDRLS